MQVLPLSLRQRVASLVPPCLVLPSGLRVDLVRLASGLALPELPLVLPPAPLVVASPLRLLEIPRVERSDGSSRGSAAGLVNPVVITRCVGPTAVIAGI